jgi:DNA (cytosine-5)-methyltransferase 1
MLHELTKKLSTARGARRFWFENSKLLKLAGFESGTFFNVKYMRDQVVIVASEHGTNRVSIKTKTQAPIIDINNKQLTKSLGESERVTVALYAKKIIVKVSNSASKVIKRLTNIKQKLNLKKSLAVGAIFFGFGGLDMSLAEGFEKAGVETKLVWANEYDNEVAEHSLNVNPVWRHGGILSNIPIQDLDLNTIPDIDVLTIGYPCVGHSSFNTNKSNRGIFHKQAGLLFLHVIGIIQAKNPSIVIMEQSPNFISENIDHASMTAQDVEYYVIKRYLEEAGYEVQVTKVNGKEHGHLELRERMAMVALPPEFGFDPQRIESSSFVSKPQLKEYLSDVPLDSKAWKAMSYLDKKTAEARNGFKLRISKPDDTIIPVIPATYAKIQPDTPIIKHPESDLRRILTVEEHAKIKGFDGMFDGVGATFGHRALGNSVLKNVWLAVGESIGHSLVGFCDKLATPNFLTESNRTNATECDSFNQFDLFVA